MQPTLSDTDSLPRISCNICCIRTAGVNMKCTYIRTIAKQVMEV